MAKRVYTSTVTAAWPVQTQRELFAAKLPGWSAGYVAFHDEIDARQRRLKNPNVLSGRNELLKTTTRKGRSEDVYVAALPLFAMSIADLMHALTLAGSRGATVHFLHEGLIVPPGSGADTLHQIVTLFEAERFESRARTAGKISGDAKLAASKERAQATIGPHYGDPAWTMARYEQASGLTRNTIIRALGELADAREAWAKREATAQANAKRAAARVRRKAKQETDQ